MPYDLLIKGGHVLDPGQNIDGVMDIAINGTKIAAVEPDIDPTEAKRVIQVKGDNRYVTPGLIDIHTHVAYGATTPGVGMGCCDPDQVGVRSGVTTVLDCGSVGIANIGVMRYHVIPRAKTRIVTFVNVGSYAHTMPGWADVRTMEDVDPKAIASCIENNPGLIKGFKLRLVGPVAQNQTEELVKACKEISREHHLPLMVHIGDMRAEDYNKASAATRYLLNSFDPGDILTHLATPNPGGVMADEARTQPVPELMEARNRGVGVGPGAWCRQLRHRPLSHAGGHRALPRHDQQRPHGGRPGAHRLQSHGMYGALHGGGLHGERHGAYVDRQRREGTGPAERDRRPEAGHGSRRHDS